MSPIPGGELGRLWRGREKSCVTAMPSRLNRPFSLGVEAETHLILSATDAGFLLAEAEEVRPGRHVHAVLGPLEGDTVKEKHAALRML